MLRCDPVIATPSPMPLRWVPDPEPDQGAAGAPVSAASSTTVVSRLTNAPLVASGRSLRSPSVAQQRCSRLSMAMLQGPVAWSAIEVVSS